MKKANTNQINQLFSRGVEEVIERKHLQEVLMSGKKLRVKHGIDPTGPKIHVGRAVQLWKLREFQDAGHQIVLIIGDYTAQIGDASDKLAKRPFLSKEQVEANMKDYKKQIGKILNIKNVEWHYNSEWLASMTPRELDELAELFSVQQMIARRNFKERFEKGEEISLRELHYPLYQGFDSVAIKADVEIGGSDQLFNMLAGRKIQERHGMAPQDVITTEMIYGLDGRKMSTSWGNVVTILDEPNEMYGRLMSMTDEAMPSYATLVARILEEERPQWDALRKNNPKGAKMEIARRVVALYHNEKAAYQAGEEFERIHKEHQAPEDISELRYKVPEILIVEVLVDSKLVKSKTEARQAIEQGGVKADTVVIKDVRASIKLTTEGTVIQKGKRGFVRVGLEPPSRAGRIP